MPGAAAAPTDPMTVFDRRSVRHHRDRAAATLAECGFLLERVALDMADRLEDVVRPFPMALDLGARDGVLGRALGGRKGIKTLIACELSPALAARLAGGGQPALAGDEECLPFAAASFDLVLSNLSLHWVNDLPGALLQIREVLRPDGMLLATLLGGDTLFELRRAMMEAELALRDGVSPRVSPFTDVRDAGGLLQRAGFALPVVDLDSVTVRYESPFRLLADLRGMGETAAHVSRDPAPPPRRFWVETARLYQEMFGDAEGRVPATFEVITLTGWAPSAEQQRPLRPGSAQGRLAEALGTEERSTGIKAGR